MKNNVASGCWNGKDSGILRKKEERDEELFVFGYSCKIFSDNDKAQFIDQGKHLIPWMGDETLKIDRYDCRGALNDLTQYTSSSQGYDRWMGFTSEERRVEELCDKERYRALHENESEDSIYQEEELKRLHQALNSHKSYSEVGYTYNDANKSHLNPSTEESENANEDDNEPFVPSFQMDIPMGMKIPETKKQHGIIEKTALFINQQGPQMEVLLKIKQADNPQFKFLSFDDELYPYYRYLLVAVKNQHYKPMSDSNVKESPSPEVTKDHYLHPTLNPNNSLNAESAPAIPSINYKPSADCTYSALVNRIKETTASSLLENIKKTSRKSRSISNEHRSSRSASSSSSCSNRSSKSRTEYKNSAIHCSNEETQFMESVLSSPPLSALSKSARRRRIKKAKEKAAAESYKYYFVEDEQGHTEDSKNQITLEEDETKNIPPTKILSNEPSVDIKMQSDEIISKPVIQIPPPNVQLIIDKMASYVAKNGRDFEDIVRGKGDTRFLFLDSTHMYNPYYNQKVDLYLQLEMPQQADQNSSQISEHVQNSKLKPGPSNQLSGEQKKHKSKTNLGPICFAIKKPKDQETLEVKTALPYEESENDSENESDNEETRMETEVKQNNEANCSENKSRNVDDAQIFTNVSQSEQPKKPIIDPESWAKERLKAKLMMTAKEKIAAKEKDKQLQAERRRKAAEFINLLQKDNLLKTMNVAAASLMAASSKEKGGTIAPSEIISLTSGSSDSDVKFTSESEQKRKKRRHKSDKKKKRNYDYDNSRSDDDNKRRSKRGRDRSRSDSKSRSKDYKCDRRHKKKKKSDKYDEKSRNHLKSRKSKLRSSDGTRKSRQHKKRYSSTSSGD